MSAGKHTAGPWNVVNTAPSNPLDIAVVFDADSQVVCCVPKGSSSKSMLERRANARLIAAAPDLLEALELCLHAVGLAGWEDDYCAQKARAAIQKATGGGNV